MKFIKIGTPSKEYVKELYDETLEKLYDSFMSLAGWLGKDLTREELIDNPYVMRNLKRLREDVKKYTAFMVVYHDWLKHDQDMAALEQKCDSIELSAQTSEDTIAEFRHILAKKDSNAAFNDIANRFNAEVTSPCDKASVDAAFDKILKSATNSVGVIVP